MPLRSKIGYVGALAVLVLLVSSVNAIRRGGQRQTLMITGSSTLAPLIAEIAKRFERLHPGIRVDVQTGGSSRGIADVRNGVAAIGMVSRALADSEADLHGHPIALDGVALIVHASNPIRALSDDEVRAIYTGKIRNWREVGGEDAPITVVHKAEGRATLERFLAYFKLDNTAIKPDVVIGDNEQGIKTVAGNRHAIGYVSIGTAANDIAHGVPIRMLATGGHTPSLEAVETGRFPITRPLLLVTRTAPSGSARRFIAFARSEAVHDLVRGQSFVPLRKEGADAP